MSATGTALQEVALATPPAQAGMSWYAIRTRSRHEKVVEKQLQGRGVEVFYPVVTQMHRWSDRRKMVESPLFAGYAFVRIAASPEERVKVLRAQGVVEFVGGHGQGTPIPAEQMDAVRAVVASNTPSPNMYSWKWGNGFASAAVPWTACRESWWHRTEAATWSSRSSPSNVRFPSALKATKSSQSELLFRILPLKTLSRSGHLVCGLGEGQNSMSHFPIEVPEGSTMDDAQRQTKPNNGADAALIEGEDEPIAPLRSVRARVESQAILAALKRTGWNRKQAARMLKISYRGLLYKIRQHNITAA